MTLARNDKKTYLDAMFRPTTSALWRLIVILAGVLAAVSLTRACRALWSAGLIAAQETLSRVLDLAARRVPHGVGPLPALLASEQRNVPVVNSLDERRLVGSVLRAEALGLMAEAIAIGSTWKLK